MDKWRKKYSPRDRLAPERWTDTKSHSTKGDTLWNQKTPLHWFMMQFNNHYTPKEAEGEGCSMYPRGSKWRKSEDARTGQWKCRLTRRCKLKNMGFWRRLGCLELQGGVSINRSVWKEGTTKPSDCTKSVCWQRITETKTVLCGNSSRLKAQVINARNRNCLFRNMR